MANTPTNRLMIILWSWRTLTKAPFFDTVQVHQSQGRDKIIRINKRKEDKGDEIIIEQAKSYFQDHDIFVFLHRDHGFDENIILQLLNDLQKYQTDSNRVLRCFLFSEGRDFIYYQTKEEGLLASGDFMRNARYKSRFNNPDGKTEKIDVTIKDLDTKEKMVKPQHFDRVWNYYQNEFEKKIISLQIDTIAAFVEIMNPAVNDELISCMNWKVKIEALEEKTSDYLLLRLKSFLDYEDMKLSPTELQALQEFEKEKQISYEFDDCSVNLGEHLIEEVQEAYQILRDRLKPVFLEQIQDCSFSLNELNEDFENLVKALKNK
jgi:hypothetical protein